MTDPEKGVQCACLRSATVGRKAGESGRERVILICFHIIMMIRIWLCYAMLGMGTAFGRDPWPPGASWVLLDMYIRREA